MKYVFAILAFLFCSAAQAQDALVVQTCGTLPLAYAPGATRLLTVDTTGKLCGTGGGGAGNPGGSNTQVQYNNAGSFGGITGATSNGTTLTLVAPVLGTPASGTLTNTTGFPVANLAGAGTGVLASLAATLNSSTGPVGALTPTSNNCVVGNGSAWTSTTCPAGVTSAIPSTQTGTNYAIVDSDRAKVIYLSNAAAQTPTLPSAATLTNSNGWFVTACNINAGIQTITPTTSTIGGAASYALPGGTAISPRCVNAVSDGTNYLVVPQGNIYQIASGTLALGTSAVSAGTCGTASTLSAPGVVTTDRITVGFNGDPTATTGYLPTAMLTLVPYPTANNINIKQCNLTASSITPAALTVNLQVNR
jgi:hypothetical protein